MQINKSLQRDMLSKTKCDFNSYTTSYIPSQVSSQEKQIWRNAIAKKNKK